MLIFDTQCLGTPENVRQILIDLRATLDRCFGDQQTASAEIVLAEILNNIVKHAQSQMSDGWVRVQVYRDSGLCQIVITDNGVELPDQKIPQTLPPKVSGSRSDLPEGGWGWYLARTLAQNIHYKRNDNVNKVCLTIPPS